MSQIKTKAIGNIQVTAPKLGSGAATTGQVIIADGSGGASYSSTPTLSGPVVGTQSSSDNSTKAASTAFVTTAVANAIAAVNPAMAVQAATTQASDTSGLTYNNGVSGIGATLTGSTNTALTFDGFTITGLNQRVLVKNDTQSPSGAFNGVYFLSQLQTVGLPPILTRALDFDQPSDINNTGAIPVVNGTLNADTSWLLTSTVNTVGTDPLTFIKFTANPSTLLSNTLTSAHLFVGNGSNVATDVAASGDLTLSNTGAFTIANLAVTNAKIANTTIDLTAKVTNNLPIGNGGTNASTASGARTNLGLAIGTDVQAFDAQLSSLVRQNSQSAAYTTVLTDSGKHILHPSADTTARTFTIDSNANVAYSIGTAITFVNQHSAGVVTIAITSDTMRLAGTGTTGSRTLAADGIATALKITSTEWIISGTGLT